MPRAAATTLISLDDLKRDIRLPDSDELDDFLTICLESAVERAEQTTGRVFLPGTPRTYGLLLETGADPLKVWAPDADLNSFSLQYWTGDGNATPDATISVFGDVRRRDGAYVEIWPVDEWPQDLTYPRGIFSFEAGMQPSEVPPTVKSAIILLAKMQYVGREDGRAYDGATAAAHVLLANHQVLRGAM